ncbi:cyclic AMP-responsive element-binding protein 3-like protein 1 [Clonorchis sinensis]|uniref:Cyclic AMP-responsive element-binding protein 3-like protein 1 n=1 Tax=Clonorchis sinensis TaxID=79923 RepID=G7YBW3_CLOSI|nr:cyclic AMP-responsive element-binding protein 3-like protein 1 [Clonorchis sinensis]
MVGVGAILLLLLVNIDDLLTEDIDMSFIEDPEVVLEATHSTVESGHSSGYTSGGSSSGAPSPNSSSSKTGSAASLSQSLSSSGVFDVPPRLKKVKVECSEPILQSGFRAVPEGRTHLQLKPTLSTVSTSGSNRVRFIVRPNRVINIQAKNKAVVDSPIYSNVSRLQSVSKSHLHTVSVESKGRWPAFDILSSRFRSPGGRPMSYSTKNPGIVHFVKTVDGSLKPAQSPAHRGSISSSDSDMRDSVDEDCATALSDLPEPRFGAYEFSNVSSVSRIKTESGRGYSGVCSSSPVSRISGLNYLPLDDSADGQYFQASRLSAQSGVLRGQPSTKGKSPTRIERSDVSQAGILVLTDEEKRTLLAEGYSIPTRLPLSKQEERNLKRVRRKIKNKISAQESRRKKKEYVEALERKLNACAQENMDLKRRNDGLESTNRSLLGQLRLMQQLLNKSKTTSGGATGTAVSNSHPNNSEGPKAGSRHNSGSGSVGSASTCLMVFALCFAALLVGQPPDLNSHTSVGLTFGPHPHSLLNNLIANGPGSLSHIGYTWSNHRDFDATSISKHVHRHHGSNCSAFSLSNSRDRHIDRVRRIKWRDDIMSRLDKRRPLPQQPAVQTPVPRSRLLGAPNELDECIAAPRSFWSYLFGIPPQPAAICVGGIHPTHDAESEFVLEFQYADSHSPDDPTLLAENRSGNAHNGLWFKPSIPLVSISPPSNFSSIGLVMTSA